LLITSVLSIRNHSPHSRTYHAERHLGFETRLIKAWEYSVAMESFKLRIEILLAIRLVDELMKPSPVFLIWSKVLEAHNIPSLAQINHFKSDLLPCEV
jgi:cephalosporin-C deacetylase-like acetyl esterase